MSGKWPVSVCKVLKIKLDFIRNIGYFMCFTGELVLCLPFLLFLIFWLSFSLLATHYAG